MTNVKKPIVPGTNQPVSSTTAPEANVATGSATPVQNSAASPTGQPLDSTLVRAADVKGLTLTPPMKDVRGWNVTGPGKTVIGVVDAIMLDRTDQKPRYLTVTLSENRGKMLLPIGVGTADLSSQRVMLDDLKPEVLKALLTLTQERITPEFERKVVTAVTGVTDSAFTPSRWYARAEFDAANLFAAAH